MKCDREERLVDKTEEKLERALMEPQTVYMIYGPADQPGNQISRIGGLAPAALQ
jgi:hypothetical protein